MSQQLDPFEWEITAFQDDQKKSAYSILKIIYISLMLLFFFSGLAFILMIISAVMLARLSQTRNLSSGRGVPIEKYKIDEKGIFIENLKYDRRSQYSWTDLASYYSYNKANPLPGSFLRSRIGDDFTVVDKKNNRIELRAGTNDSDRVDSMLSQKLKLRLPSQSAYYPNDRSFKLTPISGWGDRQPKMMNLQRPVKKFDSGEEEKRFYEQRRMQEHSLRKNKERSTGKTVLAVYLAMVFFSIMFYLAFSSAKEEKIKTMDNLIETRKNGDMGKDDDYWYYRGWPENDRDLVKCRSDVECESYFYYKTDKAGANREKSISNPDIRIMSDNNSCAWGVINKKYGLLWQERYPKPSNCVMSAAPKSRKFCDALKGACAYR